MNGRMTLEAARKTRCQWYDDQLQRCHRDATVRAPEFGVQVCSECAREFPPGSVFIGLDLR